VRGDGADKRRLLVHDKVLAEENQFAKADVLSSSSRVVVATFDWSGVGAH
jgi:hypothetical protein